MGEVSDGEIAYMRWYKRDPDAALAGMAGLTLEERGLYNAIIDTFYARDGHLPDDDWLLSRIVGCNPRTVRKVKLVLFQKQKITIEDGCIVPNRGRKTMNEARTFSELQSNARANKHERSEKTNENKHPPPPIQPQPQPQKKESIDAAPSAQPTKKRRQVSSKVPLPEGWTPNEGVRADDLAEFERFKDFARANARVYADWEAAWRNWRTSPYRRTNGTFQTQHRPTVSDAVAELRSRLVPRAGGSNVVRPAALQLQQPDRGNSDAGADSAGLSAGSSRGGDSSKNGPPDAA